MKQLKKTILTLVALLAVTTQAWAQTDVSTFADLQTALSAGNDVKLTANIQFNSAIEISGSKKILIDGNGKTMSGPSTCAFIINSGNTLAIKNATINNFDRNAGGGAIRNGGTLLLDGCTVSNNHTDGSGQGGGAIENQGTLYASNTTFSGNYSNEIGGAINNYNGNLYLSGCTFTNNYTTATNANWGGAIGNNSSNTLVLVNCTFSGNKYGGSTGTANDLGIFNAPADYAIAGCTGIAIAGATLTTYQYGTATLNYSDLSAISFTYDQSDTPIASGTPVPITWDATAKTATLTNGMPAGNVTVSVDYYPQATLATAPTAADGAKATTDDLLVSGGTVATITGSDPAAPQGTLMYYVSTSTMTTEALLALDADKWVAEPTAAGITQKCGAFVYYYVKGNDSTDDALNFSDGDISSDNVLDVLIYPAPTYAVTFADDLAEPTLWTASPNADVTKGQTVTVTYTGTKKVIGVKAEKKAKAATLADALVDGATVVIAFSYGYLGTNTFTNNNGTFTLTDATGFGAADDETTQLTADGSNLIFKANWDTSIDKNWSNLGFQVTIDTTDNTYVVWKSDTAIGYSAKFTSITVNGTEIQLSELK